MSDPGSHLVDARGLTKTFDDFVAVDGIDVHVKPGEVFGFLGPNGAGKSSTMRMVGCVSEPTAGELRIFGLDPRTDGQEIRARLGVVPQEDNLDTELTVRDNLVIYGRYFGISRAMLRERVDELLDFVQLTDRATSRVDPLSGGMKRRLTIARVLVNEPDMLLLDEPTTGLDPQARHLVWERLYQLKQRGVTQVLTTHYMDEAERLCDRLVIMDGGRIVDEGSPRQLIERHAPREVVEVRYDTNIEIEVALKPVRDIAPRVELLADRVLVYTDDGDAAVAVMQGDGFRPESVLIRRSTLEDVFLILTGRTLEDSMSAQGAIRVVEREARIYRRLWRGNAFSTFVGPSLYLGALGLGLGGLIAANNTDVEGLTYLQFVAPGLMAATALQLAAAESMWPVMAGTKWIRFYHAMVASPLGSSDIFYGHLGWQAVRLAMGGAAFLIVAAILGALASPLAIFALPAAVLTGLAFASPLTAFAATQETDARFALVMRFLVLPMFLFSGTFFPISQLPTLLQGLAWISPLWHGVVLCRAATTGSWPEGGALGALAHLVILLGFIGVGAAWGTRTFARRLVS